MSSRKERPSRGTAAFSSFALTPRSRVGGIVEVIEGIICWEIEGEEEEGRRALGRIWKDPCERVTPRFVYTSYGGRVLTGRAREFSTDDR